MSGPTSDIIINMHPISRLILGMTLLLTTALNTSIYIALFQLIISLTLLNLMESGVRVFRESIHLLCWLVVPIVVLHVFFTPGELLLKSVNIPISIEGIQLGSWFALHLVVMFLSALAFSRLLGKDEWIALMLRIPGWGERAVPYVLLLEAGLKRSRQITRREQENWRACGSGVRKLPTHITVALTDVLSESKNDAGELWRCWDQRVSSISIDPFSVNHAQLKATMVAVIVIVIIWSVYLAGVIR